MIKVGDQVTVRETPMGRGQWKKRVKLHRCRVVQVCERFVVVDNGKYRFCVWREPDGLSEIVIGGGKNV